MCPVFMGNFWTKKENRITQTRMLFCQSAWCEKMSSLAPGPALPPGLMASSTSTLSSSCSCYCCFSSSSCSACLPSTTLLSKTLCSSLHDSGGRPDQLRLVPLTLGVEELSLVAGYISAFLHTHGERFSISFQDAHLKIVGKSLIFILSSMCAF